MSTDYERTAGAHIERLEARVAELTAALEPFAREYKRWAVGEGMRGRVVLATVRPLIRVTSDAPEDWAEFAVMDLRRAHELVEVQE